VNLVIYWKIILNVKRSVILWSVTVWNTYHVVAVFLLNLAHTAVKLDIHHL